VLRFLRRRAPPPEAPPAPAPEPAGEAPPPRRTKVYRQDQGLDFIEFRDVPDAVAERVRDWFAGRVAATRIDGSRSVHLAHPEDLRRLIKVKGAGLNGGPVRFGKFGRAGPMFPSFDFNGRAMEDEAIGHDGAWLGGASFQQATVEYRVNRRLAELGHDVVPCLGYGRIEKGGLFSWFTVFDHEPGLTSEVAYPKFPLERWVDLNTRIGVLLHDLAVNHDLLGFCWYSLRANGGYLIRDLHPFRFADPFNMSQLSWVMTLVFAMHIRGNGTRFRALQLNDPKVPADIHLLQYRPFLPDVRLADGEDLRERLVIPYMLKRPEPFAVERLLGVLRGNRITAAMMESCPAKFARP
jgi:hypothetical protein